MSNRLQAKKRAVQHHPLMMTALVGVALAVAFAVSGAAIATTVGPPSCSNPATLTGSAFEIDTSANLKVDTSGCIDWLAGGAGTAYRAGALVKGDKPSGSGDDAFGQGTSENDANPTIVNGSIPPNKSDLKAFGINSELGEASAANPTGKFVDLFWARVQNPSGTTNMDFELNQKFCDPTATPTNCADNSVTTPETPLRTPGDRLITYDLSKGGTVPSISIRTWSGSAWGAATVISSGTNALALGSVNTALIPATETAGTSLGSLDPFTFGETSVAFAALFQGSGTCGSFGSAYLKSRSSDSFTSEIKDFVGPEPVHISNCTTLTTSASASVTIGQSISDTATLSGATSNATGGITFKLYGPFTNADPTTDTCVAGNLVTTLGPIAIGSANASGNYVVSSGTTHQRLSAATSGSPPTEGMRTTPRLPAPARTVARQASSPSSSPGSAPVQLRR